MQSLNDVWKIAVAEMKEEFSDAMINLWFAPLELTLLDDDTVEVICASDFHRDMMNKGQKETIQKYLKKLLGFETKLVLLSKADKEKGATDSAAAPVTAAKVLETTADEPAEAPQSDEAVPDDAVTAQAETITLGDTPSKLVLEGGNTEVTNYATNLNTYKDEYTFENYIVGSSNKFAHAACVAVAQNPASGYNPLFIYGSSGLGKTHLLYAITNEIRKRRPNFNIIFVKGEDFTNQLIESIAKNIAPKFREKYRQADVLLIDDIQFIAGKDSTQEEFFHTFNALHEAHKQIIMTSDRPPKDIKTLEERLKTRFEWGLIADVQPPDYELRMAIVKEKAGMLGLDVPEEVFTFLAENLKNDVRQLEGAIKKIGAQSYLTGVPISKELAVTCTSDIITGTEPVKVTVDKIIEKVSRKYSVSVQDIKGRQRKKEIAYARHMAIYLIRKLTDMSLPAIAKVFDRDHTTIMASIENIDSEIKSNSLLEIDIGELIKEIRE